MLIDEVDDEMTVIEENLKGISEDVRPEWKDQLKLSDCSFKNINDPQNMRKLIAPRSQKAAWTIYVL
jgi:hypothetical protein